MTTIAWDGETLAADTRQVGSYIDNHHSQKLFKAGSAHIGISGEMQQAQVFIRWFKDQTKTKPNPSNMQDFSALIVRDAKCYHAADLCELVEVGHPAAIGSGGDFAMAAMLGGADAKEAVKIAMKLDPYTGGRVKSVKVK